MNEKMYELTKEWINYPVNEWIGWNEWVSMKEWMNIWKYNECNNFDDSVNEWVDK